MLCLQRTNDLSDNRQQKGEAQSGRIETVKLCHDTFAKMRIAIFSLGVCVCVLFSLSAGIKWRLLCV